MKPKYHPYEGTLEDLAQAYAEADERHHTSRQDISQARSFIKRFGFEKAITEITDIRNWLAKREDARRAYPFRGPDE